jgi:hypothetical protein
MGRKDRTTSHSKLVLSLGAATIVAVAMFAVETKAQTSGEGLPNLEARVEPLRPESEKAKCLPNSPPITRSAMPLCTTTPS